MENLNIYETFGYISGFLFAGSLIPQLYKSCKTKNLDDFSYCWQVTFLLGMVFIFTEMIINSTYYFMLFPALLTFGISMLREIIKDLNDYKGDKKDGMKTAPIIFGKKLTNTILQYLVVLFLFFSITYSIYSKMPVTFILLLIILIEIPLLYSLFLLIKIPTKKTIYDLTKLFKIITCNGLIVLLFMRGN